MTTVVIEKFLKPQCLKNWKCLTTSYNANGKVLNINTDASGDLKAECETEVEGVKNTEYPQMVFYISEETEEHLTCNRSYAVSETPFNLLS